MSYMNFICSNITIKCQFITISHSYSLSCIANQASNIKPCCIQIGT